MIKQVQAPFTLQELLHHLEGEERQIAEGFYTLREWAGHFHVGPEQMRRLLVEAKELGKLEVQRLRRESLDGRMMQVPCYRILLEEDEESGAGEDARPA